MIISRVSGFRNGFLQSVVHARNAFCLSQKIQGPNKVIFLKFELIKINYGIFRIAYADINIYPFLNHFESINMDLLILLENGRL